MALVLHLLMTVWLGAIAVWLFVTGATGIGVVLTIGFAVMAVSMVLFTRLAAQNNGPGRSPVRSTATVAVAAGRSPTTTAA